MTNNLINMLELIPSEKSYYEKIWLDIKKKDHSNSAANYANAMPVANLMDKSNLERNDLKYIWKICCQHSKGIYKKEFFLVLKLISLKQNGITYKIENLKNCEILPKFSGIEIEGQKKKNSEEKKKKKIK